MNCLCACKRAVRSSAMQQFASTSALNCIIPSTPKRKCTSWLYLTGTQNIAVTLQHRNDIIWEEQRIALGILQERRDVLVQILTKLHRGILCLIWWHLGKGCQTCCQRDDLLVAESQERQWESQTNQVDLLARCGKLLINLQAERKQETLSDSHLQESNTDYAMNQRHRITIFSVWRYSKSLPAKHNQALKLWETSDIWAMHSQKQTQWNFAPSAYNTVCCVGPRQLWRVTNQLSPFFSSRTPRRQNRQQLPQLTHHSRQGFPICKPKQTQQWGQNDYFPSKPIKGPL